MFECEFCLKWNWKTRKTVWSVVFSIVVSRLETLGMWKSFSSIFSTNSLCNVVNSFIVASRLAGKFRDRVYALCVYSYIWKDKYINEFSILWNATAEVRVCVCVLMLILYSVPNILDTLYIFWEVCRLVYLVKYR